MLILTFSFNFSWCWTSANPGGECKCVCRDYEQQSSCPLCGGCLSTWRQVHDNV